jgi:uncharacterized membrane protein YeaQ/YmgE (transglycosylase-associated protein family)
MNIIIWLIVGGIVGWLASLIMKTDAQQGILLNVVVGIVGAFIGGWLIGPLVGAGSMIGAIILLAIVNLFRRGRVR